MTRPQRVHGWRGCSPASRCPTWRHRRRRWCPRPSRCSRRMRLSTPTIRKFSSPNCALGSTMSRESGSSAEILLSMLFFDDCHCHAPPVRASASTAITAAIDTTGDHRPAAARGAIVRSSRTTTGTDARRRHPAASTHQGQIRQFRGRRRHGGDDLGGRIGVGRRERFGSDGLRGRDRFDDLGGLCRERRRRFGFGFRAGPLQFRRNARVTVDLGDQVGDRDPVGVVAGRRGGLGVLGFGTSATFPRRGAWRRARRSGKPLVVGASDLTARTGREGQEWRCRRHSCSYRPPTLHRRARRCAWAYAVLPCLVAALCRLRHWSPLRRDSHRTETS